MTRIFASRLDSAKEGESMESKEYSKGGTHDVKTARYNEIPEERNQMGRALW